MTVQDFELRTGFNLPLDALLSLFNPVGWAAYTRNPAGLE